MTTMTDDPTTTEVTFDDFYVLSTEGVDVFVLNWNDAEAPPPYYVVVDGRHFSLTGETYLVSGHGAVLPRFVEAEEAEGRLALFVERDDRLLAYVHDPAAEAEAEPEEAASAELESESGSDSE